MFACSTRTHLTWIQQAGQSTYGPSCSLRHPDLQYVQCCVMYNYYAQFTSYKFCPLGHKRVGYVFTSYLLVGANSANLISREQGRRAQHLWAFLFTDMSMSLDMSASAYHTTQHLQLSLSVCVTPMGLPVHWHVNVTWYVCISISRNTAPTAVTKCLCYFLLGTNSANLTSSISNLQRFPRVILLFTLQFFQRQKSEIIVQIIKLALRFICQ